MIGTQHEKENRTPKLPDCLSDSSVLNQVILDTLPDLVCLVDMDWRVLHVNRAAIVLFEQESAEYFLGRSILDFILPKDWNQVKAGLKRCFRNGRGGISEYALIREDGSIIPIEASSAVLYDDAGAAKAIVCAARDITARMRADTKHQSSARRALLYVDVLGHDISNQLQVMACSAELLRETSRNPSALELIENIIVSISKCEQFIANTQTMERVIAAPLGSMCLDKAVHDTVLSAIANYDDLIVHASIEVVNAVVLADEFLNHILSSLIDNAYRHNPAEEKHVWVCLREHGTGYEVSFGDNGPGMPSDIRGRLSNIEGRRIGVGLHLCQSVVGKYGGTIEIRNRLDHLPESGTEIRVWLPRLRNCEFKPNIESD